jgi:hypothetical protein
VHDGGTAGALGDGEVKGSDGDGDMPRKGATRAHRLPAVWQPSDAHRRLADERAVDLIEEAEKFRDWCAANGATKKDWEATFRNWIRNARPSASARPMRRAPDEQGRIPLPPLPRGVFEQ